MWQELFGVGLVETSGDFGIVGERPSHPALLDWLAVDFVESGWRVKRLYKTLVMSATYRQSVDATEADVARDPANRLLSSAELRKMVQGYENVREALGWGHEILIGCHWEFDLRAAIDMANALKPIKPLFLEDPLPVLATVMIIMFGRSLAVFLVVLAFRHSVATATVIAFSRAQIGEFSFILAGLGVTLGLLPEEGQNLVLAGAMITIVLNPLLLFTAERLRPMIEARLRRPAPVAEAEPPQAEAVDAAKFLVGKQPDAKTIAEAAKKAAAVSKPSADVRGSVESKQNMARVLTERALQAALERAGGK